MATLVQKFGGSSVATVSHIRALAARVAEQVKDHQIIVVVSAMQGETDRLLQLYHDVSSDFSPREKAMLVSTGEQVSASLFALALQNCGVSAAALTGAQAGIVTTMGPLKADIQDIHIQALQQRLSENTVPVICGYQGVNQQGDITTLGRGGSDLTAVAVAHAIGADECQVFTDVAGIYSADPRIVDQAILLPSISYAEMIEHSMLGARVMQQQAVEYGSRYNLPIRVLSSHAPGAGTLIADTSPQTLVRHSSISGVAFDRNQGKITVRGLHQTQGFESELRSALTSRSVDFDFLMTHTHDQNQFDLKFTVHLDDYGLTLELVQRLTKSCAGVEVSGQRGVAKLSVIGIGMQQHAQVATEVLELLSRSQIDVQLLAASHYTVSVIIAQHEIEQAARLLHSNFILNEQTLSCS